jgi:hypothetical protein
MYSKSNGDDDEEKITSVKSINLRLIRLEKKLENLFDKEKKDEIIENDIPLYFLRQIKTNKNSISLLSKILTENLWKKLYTQRSEEGFNINDLIQPGIDNPNHFSGLVSHSKDCYFSFDELLIQAAQNFHKRNIYLTKYEKENFNDLIILLNNMQDFLSKIIYEININTNRNIENFLFSGKIKRNERRVITKLIKNNLEKIQKEISVDNYNENEKGDFVFMHFDEIKNTGSSPASSSEKNINDFLNNRNSFFSSCGFYRDFPEGRMLFTNKNRAITILSNFEDHLKLSLKAKNKENDLNININTNNNENNNFDVKNLLEYYEFLNKLSENIEFVFDRNLGYVNSLIENLGILSYFIFLIIFLLKNIYFFIP